MRPTRLLLLALFACSLPRPGLAGPNADVEIDLTAPGAPCGWTAEQNVRMGVAARAMNGVRQIKFELSWEPPTAVASVTGALGAETEKEAFIAPGQPFVEGDFADWGIAVFGGEGLAGAGHLADLDFQLAAGVDPTTPIAIYLDAVSLGPSSAERDTIRPQPAMILGNYCDAEGELLPPGLTVNPPEQKRLFSPMDSGEQLDQSTGETRVSARIFDAGRFRVGEVFQWTVENLGPGPIYALVGATALRIDAGTSQQINTASDHRGTTSILLDAESGAEGQSTAAAVKVCGGTEILCGESQVTWESPITAVLTPLDAQPQRWTLEQNYPNPFNAGTAIAFAVPQGAAHFTRLDIFNLSGQKVATPFDGIAAPGRHAVHWDGRTASGAPAGSGLYIYRLSAKPSSAPAATAVERHRTMILLR